jgi:DNA-binding MarR family transcriptional regulator
MKGMHAKDLAARLNVIVEGMNKFLVDNIEPEMKDNLTPAQLLLLHWMQVHGDNLSAGRIREACYFGTNVSFNLAVLYGKGYVSPQHEKGDRRVVRYTLTDKAKPLVARIGSITETMEAGIGNLFPVEAMRQMEAWFLMIGHDFGQQKPEKRLAAKR